jgi:hypothetical protein
MVLTKRTEFQIKFPVERFFKILVTIFQVDGSSLVKKSLFASLNSYRPLLIPPRPTTPYWRCTSWYPPCMLWATTCWTLFWKRKWGNEVARKGKGKGKEGSGMPGS